VVVSLASREEEQRRLGFDLLVELKATASDAECRAEVRGLLGVEG